MQKNVKNIMVVLKMYVYIYIYIYIYIYVYALYNASIQVKPECSIWRAIYTMAQVT